MNASTALPSLANQVAQALERTGRQLVLAESCTAGLVAASLGGVPGISRHLCGSAVVYQEPTKTAWLGIPPEMLAEHGDVSREVAAAMTAGALAKTPHADLAAAVTGHLGPNAPADLDGVMFVAVQLRGRPPRVTRTQLAVPTTEDEAVARSERQRAAAEAVLARIAESLASEPASV